MGYSYPAGEDLHLQLQQVLCRPPPRRRHLTANQRADGVSYLCEGLQSSQMRDNFRSRCGY